MPSAMFQLCVYLFAFTLLLSGCSVLPGAQDAPETLSAAQSKPTAPAAVQSQAPKTATGLTQTSAVAIVTDGQHSSLEQALLQRLATKHGGPGWVRFSLENANADVINALIEQRNLQQIVTIGDAATMAISPSTTRSVVFCGVRQPTDYLSQGYLGVAAAPSFELQLSAWQKNHPNLAQVGVLVSQDHADELAALAQAADTVGLELIAEVVASDREASFVLENIAPDIQGYIYLPDPNILSPQFIQTVQQASVRFELAQLAYTPLLLNLPGIEGIAADPGDVAEQALSLLQLSINPHGAGSTQPGFRPLQRALITSSPLAQSNQHSRSIRVLAPAGFGQ